MSPRTARTAARPKPEPEPERAAVPAPRRRRRSVAGPIVGLAMALVGGGVASIDDGAQIAAAGDQPAEVLVAIEELLGQLRVQPELARSGYDRDRFAHWSDLDADGCDTREEVLLAERVAGTGTVNVCQVVGGRWYSDYDGLRVTDPRDLDIDHVVALGEAWDSGAKRWDDERRERYANDLGYRDALIAVSATSNRQKSDLDPAEWQPIRTAVWCKYATWWTKTKVRWNLAADAEEMLALRRLFGLCRTPPDTAVTLAP